jgi:hypothetical protein
LLRRHPFRIALRASGTYFLTSSASLRLGVEKSIDGLRSPFAEQKRYVAML